MTSTESREHVGDVSPAKEALVQEKKGDVPLEAGVASQSTPYLSGWRFGWTWVGGLLGVFLATMETTIVTTALVNITNELQAFSDNAWIINAYILAFTGLLIVWVQFSSVIGRKVALLLSYALFIAFSAGCAGAKTAFQLILLRAFQGIGGAGVFNVSTMINTEITKPEEIPKYTALTAIVYVVGYVIGPIIGGAISNDTTWRWVFWINIPASVVPVIIMIMALPNGFPYQNAHEKPKMSIAARIVKLDAPGAALFLGSFVCLATALQGAYIAWEWSSATSICLFIFSGIMFILFVYWERYITLHKAKIVPVLTWKFYRLKTVAAFADICLVGTPFVMAYVQLPQRFQILYGLSPLQAGVRLLPFIIIVPFMATVAAILVQKFKIKHAYAALVGCIFQLVGAICFAVAIPHDVESVPSRIYGFQIITGIGLGINNSVLVTVIPYIVDAPLIAGAVATSMQFRYLGGALGLAIVTAVLNSHVRSVLASVLTPGQLTAVLQSIQTVADLPPDLGVYVREAFASGWDVQWKTSLGFIAAQFLVTLALI